MSVETSKQGDVAIITIANPAVNALGAAVRAGLFEQVQAANSDPAVKAIVLTGAGRFFSAGADISEFGKTPQEPLLPAVCQEIENCTKPVVAALPGPALGGGCELTLSCHARIALTSAELGLPEVKLGLLPGAGGTQRLPRLIGAKAAFAIMLDGEPLKAKKALEAGILDAVVESDVVAAAAAHALSLVGKPLRRTGAMTIPADQRGPFEAAAAAAFKKDPEAPNLPALVESVRAAFDKPLAEGMKFEREQFMRLIKDERSIALRHAFFAERGAARVADAPKDTKAREVAKVAIIGGGTMGGGIAMSFVAAGVPVTLIENDDEALKRGVSRIGGNYDFSVSRGSMTEARKAELMGRIDGRVGLEATADADLIIEAVFEDMGVKKDVFGKLDKIAKKGAILATNTSYLDVDTIAAATSRPADVVGLHFFSPANVMKLLEIVRAKQTAPDVLITAVALARKIGKMPVVVGNCHGFVGNRMLARRSQQVERLLTEGALPPQVDAALRAFGFRMGPCAMSDLAGLDISWRMRKATGQKAPVADALCEAGRFGQKAGRGYYLYQDGRTPTPDPEVEQLLQKVSQSQGITRRAVDEEEITQRLIYPMINEGARILAEGIAARSADIDVVWVHGYNFPRWRGGPMHYADQVGLAQIAAKLEAFSKATGDESLAPAPLLRELAAKDGSFAKWTPGGA
jgi:3-hydroxyacyl-CoA dehydrogenase